jgi:HNH endonuclease
MARKAISRTVRRQVRDRARNRCEYCQHPANYACAPFVCEHITPQARGGGSSITELAWACPACNSHKYAKTHAPDPHTGRTIPLFNPRWQRWSRHFAWSEDYLLLRGRTATGRATVEALHLNRPELINLRRALRVLGVHP